ncbi:MAG: hypothetical protein A3J79_13640 [Elusimicrobia bacterium RIFOXYB2_FULL_62_6]|nr:MAG: hypothetical protein A3J79_13640 [Elusimicrobia bacterium RIFOXYB2_FULL_62_6]
MKSRLLLFPALLLLSGSGQPEHNFLLNPSIRHVRRIPMPPARHKVAALIQKYKTEGAVTGISVYFQSLVTGYWFGLGEQDKFIPASLLKVYLLIRVMQEEDDSPGALKRSLTLLRDPAGKGSGSAALAYKRPEPGKQYTVDRLVEYMIRYSDNDAAYTLHQSFGNKKMGKIYRDFGFPAAPGEEDALSLKQYMMTFLTLYNSTYLGTDMSQKALEYLVGSDFKEGLAAGLPPGTRVASKFGLRAVGTPDNPLLQLHDCGIIYHHDTPYVLGVMTRGKDIKQQTAVIKELSALLYEEVDYRSRESSSPAP